MMLFLLGLAAFYGVFFHYRYLALSRDFERFLGDVESRLMEEEKDIKINWYK